MEKRIVFTPQRYIPSREADYSWNSYLTDSKDPPGFVVKKIDDTIGKGVFSKNKIPAGSFIMEYSGELIDNESAQRREREYPRECGSYMLFFRHKRKLWCIDATFSKAYGRYVNDGTGVDRNAELKVVEVENKPRVVLFATRNIKPNEEIRYDYGVPNLPWRVKAEKGHSLRSRDVKLETKTLHNCELKNSRVLLERCDKALAIGKTYFIEKEDGTSIEVSCNLNVNESTMSLVDTREAACTVGYVDTDESIKHNSNGHGYQANDNDVEGNQTNENDVEVYQTNNNDGEDYQTIDNDVKGYQTNNNDGEDYQTIDNDEIYLASPYFWTGNIEQETCVTSETERKDILESKDNTSEDISEITVIIEDQDQHVIEENSIVVMPRQLVEEPVVGDSTGSLEENAPSSDFRKLSLSVTKKGHLIMSPQNDGTLTKSLKDITGNNSNKSLETQDATSPMVSEEDETSLLRIEDCTPNDRYETDGTRQDYSDQVGTSEIKHQPKPHRPCPYCMCNKSALTKHLKAKHSDEAEVKTALSLPKQKQNRAFLLLKRKGIMVKNMEMLRDSSNKHKELLVERKSRKAIVSKSKDVIYCSKCFGFFHKEYFHRHRRTCHLKEDSTYVPFAIPPQNKSIQDGRHNSHDDFNAEILSSFHNDDIGNTCKKDSTIQDYGRKKFRKLQKRKLMTNYEDRKNVIRTEMRRLGHLLNEFGDVCDMNNIHCDSSVDMLKRDNFHYLQTAIENMTIDDDGQIKPGLRKDIGYLLKRFAKYLHGHFSVEKKDDMVSELNKFLDVLNHFWQDVFGEAEYALSYKRQTQLRKPHNLPKDKDIKKLRDVMLSKLKELSEDDFCFISCDDFRLIRDIVVSRLTLFNARRGGEPSRLTIHQWEEAEQDNWIGEKGQIQDPIEKALLGKFKITYQAGKGGKLVPLLILNDCWNALSKLCNSEIRKQAGIHPENTYVFPLTQYSKKHVSGWKSVRECCSMAELETMITATSMRHYMATVYAGLEMSESDRETFYAHMGHSASINKNVYQSPLARQEITKIGKFLEDVDTGIHGIATSSKAATHTNIEEKQDVYSGESDHETVHKKGEFIQTMEKPDSLKTKESDSDYHPSSDDSDENSNQRIEVPTSPRKKRTYIPWGKEDTRLIQKYFRKYIFSSDVVSGNCGPLPNVKELKAFLVKHPAMLKELPPKDQVVRLRTKIFNERKLSREKLSKSTGQGKKSADV